MSDLPLVLKSNASEEREVIGGVLVKVIVAYKNHLHFLHVVLLIHLEGASIHYFMQCWLVRAGVKTV